MNVTEFAMTRYMLYIPTWYENEFNEGVPKSSKPYQSCKSSQEGNKRTVYSDGSWFSSVGFYGISTIVGYFIPNPLYTYISNIMIWFGWVLWHFNHCRLFNAKSSLYIYIK